VAGPLRTLSHYYAIIDNLMNKFSSSIFGHRSRGEGWGQRGVVGWPMNASNGFIIVLHTLCLYYWFHYWATYYGRVSVGSGHTGRW